ncbi:MAG: hypothetical protein LBO06_01755, partial [Bacteroidales bacterium]|nr:hypothetical protein [Bacteroidales bacterium]
MFLALAMLLAANNVSYAQCTISGLGGGTGDQADPYIISSIGHLVALSDYFSHYGNACYASYFKITADIDAAGSAFVPLSYFGGNIDGQHHTISNITTTGRAGFIEYGDGCHISNLGLVNVNVLNNTNTGVGGFVGSVYGGVFVRCYVSGGHIEGTEDVGGFVGYDDPYSNYNQCYSTANVIAAGRDDGFTAAGGFGGYCYGVFYNCYAKGNVTGTSLANYAPGAYIGGFIGVSERNNGDGTQFFNCYARGNVSGRGVVGGFAGGPNYTNDAAHNCYSTGQVSRIADTLFGGFYGWVGGVSDCYYVSTWQGTDATGDNWSSITNTNVGTGYTSAYMQTTSFLAEINANATNPINPYIADVSGVNGGYPILSWMEYGSEANPYLIYTIEDLRGLSDSVQNNHLQAGKYWYLMNDLTFTDADLIYDLDADGTAESN